MTFINLIGNTAALGQFSHVSSSRIQLFEYSLNKDNNTITELRTILQRESQNS
jgi:hypothetical protein